MSTTLSPAPAAPAPATERTSSGRNRPKRRTRRRLIFFALGIACLGAAATWWTTRHKPAAGYLTVVVDRGKVTRSVTATGTVNPVLTIIVGSYVSGVIRELFCDYNTKVTRGQVCAKIDPRPYQTVVDQASANLATANAQLLKDRANLALTTLSYERATTLQRSDYVSRSAVDSAKNAYDQSVAQVALDSASVLGRQAELKAAEVNLGYTNIVSPVNGTVVSRNVTMGETVAASFQTPTLFLIATDLTKMEVDANISESDIGGVKDGDSATFTVEAFPERVFSGVVTQVRQSPQTVQNVVTYDVVVTFANGDRALKPGMTATTRIVIARRENVLRVPDQALRYTPGGLGAPSSGAPSPHVWILRDGQPVRRDVTVGLDDDTNAEIVTGGLAEGERVIVSEQRAEAAKQGTPARAPRL